MSELKKCPCGGDARLVYVDGQSYGLHNGEQYTSVGCSSCSFSADDVDDWNTRADGWVSVDDRLPNADDQIIMCNDHGDRFSGKGSVLISTNSSGEPLTGRRSRYTNWQLMPIKPTADK